MTNLIKERFKIKNPHKDSITIENIESIIGLLGFTSKPIKAIIPINIIIVKLFIII